MLQYIDSIHVGRAKAIGTEKPVSHNSYQVKLVRQPRLSLVISLVMNNGYNKTTPIGSGSQRYQ